MLLIGCDIFNPSYLDLRAYTFANYINFHTSVIFFDLKPQATTSIDYRIKKSKLRQPNQHERKYFFAIACSIGYVIV